ncbi:hypothetical protein B0181_10605 [Moraxella caviae]|nr:PBSX family phage terminase large subunit [Moraxella caviae]OOR87292.1 hypothetical protein B0181_10605 [Moraxella caviae]
MVDVTFPQILTPVFDNLSTNLHDAITLYGGRGGAKSQALVALGVLESYIDDGVILCCREIQKSINDSIYGALVSFITDKNLTADFDILKTEIKNRRTGAKFIFAGLKHNITNIKSINKLRCVLVDEAENVSQESWDYLRPTPRYKQTRIYVVFNPRFEDDPTYQEFVTKADERTLVIKIGYQDNPWFPSSLENQRLRDLRGDSGRYAWIWEGEFLKLSDASILGHKLRQQDFELDGSFGDPLIGIDWGFSQDPTAVIECYEKDDTLYIYNAKSKVQLQLDDTADWLIRHVPNITRYTSRADNARPETIAKVKKDGVKLIKACRKWKGSVEDGIAHLQSYKAIIVHSQAMDCYAELVAYSYKKDKFDEPTVVPADKDNHFADALRYAIEPIIGRGKFSYLNV